MSNRPSQRRILTREAEVFPIAPSEWAEALALALRFGWNPPTPSTWYLEPDFHVSGDSAQALCDAFDRAFELSLEKPLEFYPVRIDMGQLYQLNEFIRNGPFTVADEEPDHAL